MKPFFVILLAAGGLLAEGSGRMVSHRAQADFTLTADPGAPQWRNIPGAWSRLSPPGEAAPANHFETRSVWTDNHIYFLFICPYDNLNLKEAPSTTKETPKLWTWDVAEVFIGADFEKIHQYREFQVSPQGEWVDLDIDRKTPKPEGGWLWNSGFEVAARIDAQRKIWYGAMKIPIRSIDPWRPARAGNEFRMNLYRLAGKAPDRQSICWQKTGERNHHVPEAFGRLVLGR